MTKITPQSVDVCICTYRRACLAEALASLGDQILPAEMQLSVMVIDNDDTPSAKDIVNRFSASTDHSVRYVHCLGSNISIARNAALDESRTRYLAFMDDDEVADPHWISRLLGRMKLTGADIVLGPVRAIYDQQAPNWMIQLDVHSTQPVLVDGQYQTGYSCNVLMDRQSQAVADLQFDLSLGRSGGEDTWFFTEVINNGGHIAFAADAVVTEKVPADRATFTWLATRRYRMGQSHGLRLVAHADWQMRLRGILTASAKIAFCALSSLLVIFSPVRRNKSVLRGCLHAGALSSHLGMRQIELYGGTATGIPQ